MRIGDLAKQLSVTPKTLRHYERIGLLGHPAREGNNYRDYDTAAVERMRVIVGLRALGLSLEQVGTVMRDDARGRREKLAEWLDRETQELSVQMSVLQGRHEDLRARLEALAETERGAPSGCVCAALMQRCGCGVGSAGDDRAGRC